MFYKFIKLKTCCGVSVEEQLESLLVAPSIKFSPVRFLNDPNEFRFFLILDKEDRNEIENHWLLHSPGKTQADFKAWFNDFDDFVLQSKQTEWLHEKKKYQVASLSLGHKSNLLWSHYAGDEGGFCLIYKDSLEAAMAKQSNYAMRGNVDYADAPPRIKDYQDSRAEIHKKIFFTKQREWDYEREYRFVILNPSGTSSFVPIAKDCVFGVILGVNLREDLKAKINSLCTQLGYRCFEVQNYGATYRLDTVEIKNEERLWIARI